jgi:hypothetical protein
MEGPADLRETRAVRLGNAASTVPTPRTPFCLGRNNHIVCGAEALPATSRFSTGENPAGHVAATDNGLYIAFGTINCVAFWRNRGRKRGPG